ncbi:DUF3775 domain-containing protein [Luteipulveratus sp. YIM 133132]|uniref:DUF3775 domain-containing protein n=1 Tax=Luteipulveratus flavus TaxID=3031728 RepID=A0ABT6C3P8_9MICO|nr:MULTISPECIES: DUF3775 domain-containing protein [unclassified Luteipulveratus]MDE9364080.1 DUF3775 domain-containing protein [Luteipulveratus sp. YIM 133132]MDF8263584.1 DUF3775 domain-containing protein [Luteipulveratus sp. YIM 133296]
MTDHSPEELDAAREAAQKAVDTATSWDYSAGEAKIADKLREGLDQAGVTVEDDEFSRLVGEIDALSQDESGGTPTVNAARPR